MTDIRKAGFPFVGVMFLLLGIFKLFQGDSWVVWFILAFLFGGFTVFSRSRSKAEKP